MPVKSRSRHFPSNETFESIDAYRFIFVRGAFAQAALRADGGADVFVHISEVEKAGFDGVHDGQKLAYEFVTDRRTGKTKVGTVRTV